MKRVIYLSFIGIIGLSCALLVVPSAVAAPQQTGQASLTLKQVKERLKQNKQYIKEAKRRAKAGDATGLNTALNNYDRNMKGLNTALSQGGFQGTPSQQEDAYSRVQSATSKHLKVLNKLLGKVPSQAVPHIQHAIEVSQTGQQTALSHLSQLQAQRRMGQANRPGFGQPGSMGRSGSAGRSGGMGGMGPGNAPMGGPGMGHPGGAPGMAGGHGR